MASVLINLCDLFTRSKCLQEVKNILLYLMDAFDRGVEGVYNVLSAWLLVCYTSKVLENSSEIKLSGLSWSSIV